METHHIDLSHEWPLTGSATTKGASEPCWAQATARLYLRAERDRGPGAPISGPFRGAGRHARAFPLLPRSQGYSGVSIYTPPQARAIPSSALQLAEFDEGRYLELARFDTPQRSSPSSAAASPAARPAMSRAKYRFLASSPGPCCRHSGQARLCVRRRCQRRPPGDRPQELEEQPEEQRLPAEERAG